MGGTYDSMAPMWQLFWPAIAFLLVLVAALAFRTALFAGFARWSGRSIRDSHFLQAIGMPSALWCIVLALFVAIEPLLTALGVGGLALALALQDTLSNLFAGMHLLADRPIRVGDYVKLSVESVEGYVVDVGWRSTRVRTLQNNVVIVPNSKVSQS